MLKKLLNPNIQKAESQDGRKMMNFLMKWKCNIVLNVKNYLSQTRLTSVIC